ncbi:MAG: cytochrome c biogenesis CcdA family protein [Peptococcaceae bacterium]|nr:cytochrome c biogenesis CcdA family protein [Peptococcaceae bacterium]
MLNQLDPVFTPGLWGLVFTEGFLAFISPCILPMLPIYLMYLSGSKDGAGSRKRLIANTLGFIAGFTVVFILLGATASGLGSLLTAHKLMLQRISGGIMIVFGLHFCGILNIPLLNKSRAFRARTENLGFISSLLFGGAFSFGWTPCLGPFLGSALLMASQASTLGAGVFLLFGFSLGLGIPFFLTALLWDRLQGALSVVRKHSGLLKMISGGFLIVVGILMAADFFGYYMALFS